MKRALIISASVMFIISGFLGCAWSIGGGETRTVKQATKGRELIDLKKAYEQDAITESEYKKLKERIMEFSSNEDDSSEQPSSETADD